MIHLWHISFDIYRCPFNLKPADLIFSKSHSVSVYFIQTLFQCRNAIQSCAIFRCSLTNTSRFKKLAIQGERELVNKDIQGENL